MRTASLGLFFLLASTCSADLFTFRSQDADFSGGERSETLFLVDDQSLDQPRFVGTLQQYDLNGLDESSGPSFTLLPTSGIFVEGGWNSWVDHQLAVLDSLQGLLLPRCQQAAAQATPPQSDYPSMLSYMASSRFGPSILTAYARQVDQDFQPRVFSLSVDGQPAELDVEEEQLADEEEEEVEEGSWQTDASDPIRTLSEHPEQFFGRHYDAGVTADLVDQEAPLFSSPSVNEQETLEFGQPDAYINRVGVNDDMSLAATCNFGLFILLSIGCIAVWIGLVRAWVSCCRLEQQTTAARKAQQVTGTNPLLTPLIPEGAVSSTNPAFGEVEVASEHPMRGSYYAPQGAEFVSIAYVPLQSEERTRA